MNVTFRDKWRAFFGATWRSAGSAQIVIISTFLDDERRGDLDNGQALFFQCLHPNLRRRIEVELARHPELSWDAAVARIVRARQ